jgi:Lipase (class 3)
MADPQKEVPNPQSSQDLDALLPAPGKDGYVFFEHARDWPLEKTLQFRHVNCWWMIESSYLVYSTSEDYVIKQLQAVNLEGAVFGFDKAQPPHILVAHNKQLIVVAFRGTRIQDLPDILADLSFFPELTSNGFVHSGFQKALLSAGVWDEAKGYIGNISGTQLILFTGHSLGAALATLARRSYRDPKGRQHALYTFGSPRVGDELIFRPNYPTPDYRVVNDSDVVPHVPTPPLYGHVGSPMGTDGLALAGGLWERLEHDFSDVAAALGVFSFAERRRRLCDYFGRQSCKPLGDHAPRVYATKIWNSLN